MFVVAKLLAPRLSQEKNVNFVKWYSCSRSIFSGGKIVLFHLAQNSHRFFQSKGKRSKSPVARFRTSRCHFRGSVRDGTYSRSQRFQKWLVIIWECFHLFLLHMSRSVTTSIGRLLLARPIKKWFGVNASSSCGLLLTCVSGRLFNSDSTSVRKVSNVLSVTCCLAATAFSAFFAD